MSGYPKARGRLPFEHFIQGTSPAAMSILCILRVIFVPFVTAYVLATNHRLHIYDLQIDPVIEKALTCPGFHRGDLPFMFQSEFEIAQSLRMTPFHTTNMAIADYILVGAHPMLYQYCLMQKGDIAHDAAMKIPGILSSTIVPWLAKTQKRWNETNGSNFIFIFSSGVGSNFIIPSLAEAVIFAVSGDMSRTEISMHYRRIVTIPPLVAPLDMLHTNFSMFWTRREFESRRCFGHFRGLIFTDATYDPRGTRLAAVMFSNSSEYQNVLIKAHLGYADSSQLKREIGMCRFGLALPGYYPFTPRYIEYLTHGVIPVIVDSHFQLAFHNFIDWSILSYRYYPDRLINFEDYVHCFSKVSYERYLISMNALDKIKKYIIWETQGGSAWTIAIKELRRLQTNNGFIH